MSRFVTVPSGDYKVKVQSGGEIKLDTGVGVGNTRVTGNLIVEGTQTQVTSNELTVKDNIIEVRDNTLSDLQELLDREYTIAVLEKVECSINSS